MEHGGLSAGIHPSPYLVLDVYVTVDVDSSGSLVLPHLTPPSLTRSLNIGAGK